MKKTKVDRPTTRSDRKRPKKASRSSSSRGGAGRQKTAAIQAQKKRTLTEACVLWRKEGGTLFRFGHPIDGLPVPLPTAMELAGLAAQNLAPSPDHHGAVFRAAILLRAATKLLADLEATRRYALSLPYQNTTIPFNKAIEQIFPSKGNAEDRRDALRSLITDLIALQARVHGTPALPSATVEARLKELESSGIPRPLFDRLLRSSPEFLALKFSGKQSINARKGWEGEKGRQRRKNIADRAGKRKETEKSKNPP